MCALHSQPDVSSDEEGGDNDEGDDSDRDGALLTDDDLLDLFMKKQKRMEQEATHPGRVPPRDNGGGGDVPAATPPRLNSALQSMVTPRGGVDAAGSVSADPQLSAQARALLSPRLPEVCRNTPSLQVVDPRSMLAVAQLSPRI